MEEFLSNQQARPGMRRNSCTLSFHPMVEMTSFYLTLNCFMNPESYLVERTDSKETGGFS